MSQTHSLTGRLAASAISPIFVVRFGGVLRIFHVEIDKEVIYDGIMARSRV